MAHEQSKSKLKPTREQEEILELFSRKKCDLKIQAYAGTGKTTTLKLIAHANPNTRFLYIAYNKAMELAAKESFPNNVETRTAHSLAYAGTGIGRGLMRCRLGNSMRPDEIMRVCGIRSFGGIPPFTFWYAVKNTLRSYQNSADKKIDIAHIPEDVTASIAKKKPTKRMLDAIVSGAKKVWGERINENGSIPIEHDTYLKMWQLSNPNIHADCILFDEAQDANPVILDIILKQKSRKIFVGDKYQQIYSWRGAVNAMELIKTEAEAKLTQSFRFGNTIAKVGMNALSLRGLSLDDIRFEGTSTITSKLASVDFSKPVIGIFRTNIGIIDQAYECAKLKKKFHVVGDIEPTLRLLECAHSLYRNNKRNVRDERIRVFDTWSELKEASHFECELSSIVKVIEFHKDNFENMIKSIRSYSTDETARIIFTTVHKAKGREWEQVFLGNDFGEILKTAEEIEAGKEVSFNPEEVNILYVAVTRATHTLDIPTDLLGILSENI